MMIDEQNERLFHRAAESLREPGARDDEALAEVITALGRETTDQMRFTRLKGAGRLARARRRSRATRGAGRFIAGLAAGIAFGAGLGLGIWAGWRMRGTSYRVTADDMGMATPTRPVAALEPVQFMLVAPSATRVALVGEFNDWDPAATPMSRAGGGAWHVALPLSRGRHVYAFVVDGSSWVADPEAPLAPERWFGASNSVLLVNGERRQ